VVGETTRYTSTRRNDQRTTDEVMIKTRWPQNDEQNQTLTGWTWWIRKLLLEHTGCHAGLLVYLDYGNAWCVEIYHVNADADLTRSINRKKRWRTTWKKKRRPKRLATMDQAFSNKREPNFCEYENTHEPIQA
jgi:hypothetical protein